MQIQPTRKLEYYGVQTTPGFRACYPVTHWVAENSGSGNYISVTMKAHSYDSLYNGTAALVQKINK